MKNILVLFLLLPFAFARPADEPFVACTSDFNTRSDISPKVFDSIEQPIQLAKLVSLWGPAYRSEFSGAGTMYWRCADGRIAYAGPVSDPNAILDANPKSGDGNNRLVFLNIGESKKLGVFPITLEIE